MTVEEMAEAIGRAHGAALDAVSRALWGAVAAGQVEDEDAARLSAAIEARRGLGQAAGGLKPIRAGTHAPKPQRHPARSEALERRRRWAAAGRMPPAIASHFTTGEQAALAVIAVEVTKRNACVMAIGAIAALAGVSESTVRRALRQAKTLGFITVKERRLSRFRSDTNVVSIISPAWTSWLRLARSGGGCQSRRGTNTNAQNPFAESCTKQTKRATEMRKHKPKTLRRTDRVGDDTAHRA